MPHHADPLASLLEQVRHLVFTYSGVDFTKLTPLMRQAMGFLSRIEMDSPEASGFSADFAFLTAQMLETSHNPTFIKTALELLFKLGFLGESLAVSFARKNHVALELVLGLLGSVALEERLLFANAVLRDAENCPQELVKWSLALFERVESDDPEEILIFLEHLSNRDDAPAQVVVNRLLGGRLGVWLRQLLKMELAEEQILYMAKVLAPLESADLCVPLAALIETGAGPRDTPARTVAAVCRTARKSGGPKIPRLAAKLASLAEDGEDEARLAAIAALADLDPGRCGRPLAGLFAEKPGLRPRLVPILAALSFEGFRAFLQALDKKELTAALFSVFDAAAAAEPGRFGEIIEAVARILEREGKADAVAAATLKKRVRACATFTPGNARSPHPTRLSPYRAVSPDESEKLIDAIRRMAGLDPVEAREREAKRNLLKSFVPGAVFEKRTLARLSLAGMRLDKTVFSSVSLKNMQFQGGGLHGAVFADCRIEWSDFTETACEGATFFGCQFKHCLFQNANLKKTRFENCEFMGTHFSDSAGDELEFTLCGFSECDFYGLKASKARFRGCRIVSANFSHAAFSSSKFQGVTFRECCFEKAWFDRSSFQNASVESAYLKDCRCLDVPLAPSAIMEAKASTRKDVLRAAALTQSAAGAPPPPPSQAGTALLAGKCLEFLLHSEDEETRLRRFLDNSERRLRWAGFKMSPKAREFLSMLPGLIEAGKVKKDGVWRKAPTARIAGYAPDYDASDLLSKYLEEPLGAFQDETAGGTPIEAIHAMGSLGAIAQTKSSDLDIWVCHKAGDAAPKDRKRLEDKLDAIALQAAEDCGLEIHFFLMSVEDVRDNNFGFSGEESCGSTQAMLLKEEFYRTALALAGKPALWPLASPGSSPKAYAVMKDRLGALGHESRYADLGPIGEIGGPEFFGASLWLIVKSLKSPFKSVMKIGLLEKYLRGQGDGGLICDMIKANLFRGNDDLWETDPYALLFQIVNGYFAERDDKESMEFMRTAFIQKTGMDPVERVPTASGEMCGGRGMEFYFPLRRGLPPGAPAADLSGGGSKKYGGAFHELTALGDRFAGFLSRSYENLMAAAAKTTGSTPGSRQESPAITDRDLTMLGRKIASRFRKRQGKIMRLPFVSPPRDMFSALEIFYDDKPREPVWGALGEARGKRKGEGEEIRRETRLERLGAWLWANDLLYPEMYLKSGALAAQIAFPDVQELFAAIRAAFPLRQSFEPPMTEYLEPERMVAGLLVVNLLTPREERRIAEVSLLYVTNWGELLFQEKMAGLHLLENKPFDFLRFNIPMELDPAPRIETFTPAKAQCFKLSLSLYG